MNRIRSSAKLILIGCCGKTERHYFLGLRSKLKRQELKVTDFGSAAPQTAIKKIKTLQKEHTYNEIWLVCDKDDFDLNHINQEAKKNNIRIAYSNPCFELWFILHFIYTTSTMSTKECFEKWKKVCKKNLHHDYKKPGIGLFSKIESHMKNAIKNAKQLYATNSLRTTSTSVFVLIEKLLKKQ